MTESPKAFHRHLLKSSGVLLVVRAPMAPPAPHPGQPGSLSTYVAEEPELFVAVRDDDRVYGFSGKVDLGTGVRTSLAQIVAEELDLDLDAVEMVMGHTEATPNQGPTIASATIQISAVPLRNAAAQLRHRLIALAAERLQVDADQLSCRQGVIHSKDGACVGFGDLVAGRHERITLRPLHGQVELKDPSQYRLVGRSVGRVDIRKKLTGGLAFVHDVRVPGMVHGRVVRPPYGGRDSGEFVGRTLLSVDRDSVAGIPGFIDVVVEGDFVGVVAEREEQAIAAMLQLKIRWRDFPELQSPGNVEDAVRAQAAVKRQLLTTGDAAPAAGAMTLERTYVWPYQMHASIGPSCAVASWQDEKLTVWSGTQNPHMLRTDLSRLMSVEESAIEVVRLEASGCYGRNCADDVCADAALMAGAVGRPVRVQLMREQEHVWEPKGAAQLMDVRGSVDGQGALLAYQFSTRYPSNDAPLLSGLLTGRFEAKARTLEMGDRTAVPPYRYPIMDIACEDLAPIVRASWLRGVSALPNSFAHESMVDELAEAVGEDRMVFRTRHLDDTRAVELIEAVAARAGWTVGARGSRGVVPAEGDGWLRGRGIAYARYIHSRFPGFGAAWAAWVVDLRVSPQSGVIEVERVVVGQDHGMVVNPAGVQHQVHGNVIQVLSRTLKEQVSFSSSGVDAQEWGGYPILRFNEVPAVDVVLMDRPGEPPLGSGESASVPGPPAIASALFDATGRRFSRPPFTPDRVLQVLG